MNKTLLGKLLVSGMLLIGLVILLCSYKESQQFEGFPVPRTAELTTTKDNLEAYKWGPASEENGLPLRYQAIIRLWGWDQIKREGALTVYKKDGRDVEVVSLTDYFSISSSDLLN